MTNYNNYGSIAAVTAREKGNFFDVEIYQTDANYYERIHTDFIRHIERDSISDRTPVFDYELLTESEYTEKIFANTSDVADFGEWYDDENAKVLVIIVDEQEIINHGESVEIYINNGAETITPEELIARCEDPDDVWHDWESVVYRMDDDIREKVHRIFKGGTNLDFLRLYLQNATDDLIIG